MSQNMDRRVYVIRPKDELIEKLSKFLDSEDISDLSRPTVVMTKALDFEKHVEGWNKEILMRCKETFIADTLEFSALNVLENISGVLGETSNLEEFFDQWWLAENAEHIEIETSWIDDFRY